MSSDAARDAKVQFLVDKWAIPRREAERLLDAAQAGQEADEARAATPTTIPTAGSPQQAAYLRQRTPKR